MKKLILIFFAVSGFVFCSAAERHVYRDSSGRVTGTSTKQGNQTVYRDASGRVKYRSTQQGGRTVFRDSSGRIIMQKN